jgi:PAS domain S-box-containing protein
MKPSPDPALPLVILHLEDSPFDAEIIRLRLARVVAGLQLDWATNREEFEALLRQKPYGLILADYELPGFNAPAALDCVNALCPGTPFICVSGAIDDSGLVELLKQGATDYVRKDRLDRLPLAIQRAIEEANQRRARLAAEAALRDSKQLYQSLVDNLPQCVFRKDTAGRLTFGNQRYCEAAGQPLEQLLGKTDADLYPSDLAAKYRADDLQVMDSGKLLDTVEDHPASDGANRTVQILKSPLRDANDKIIGVQGIFWDITARKQMEEALRQQQLFANAILDSLPGIFYLYSYPELRLELWNKNHETQLGFKPAEMKGRSIMDWHLPEMRESVRKAVESAMGTGFNLAEACLLAKDGRRIPFLLTGVRFEARDKLYLIGVGFDITESKKAEAALKDSLHEKEALLKEVHHRVKNNLQVISSLLRLQAGKIEHPLAKEALQDMKRRIHSLALLHETLYHSDNLARVNLALYLKSLCQQLFRSLAAPPANIRLVLELAPTQTVMDQAIPCGLLVNELVSNSLKHAFPDGRDGEVRVELEPVSAGTQLRLRVADNGVGLPKDFDLAKTHSLGLQLVSDLAIQLRGQLTIGPGPGTSFELSFSTGVTPNATE